MIPLNLSEVDVAELLKSVIEIPYPLALAVTDTNFGIAGEDQLKIFNPFVRSRSGVELQLKTSSGLKLVIVERLL